MQLTGELKEKVEKAESKEEAKQAIEEAGMILSDDEMDQVAGGCPTNKAGISPQSRFQSY